MGLQAYTDLGRGEREGVIAVPDRLTSLLKTLRAVQLAVVAHKDRAAFGPLVQKIAVQDVGPGDRQLTFLFQDAAELQGVFLLGLAEFLGEGVVFFAASEIKKNILPAVSLGQIAAEPLHQFPGFGQFRFHLGEAVVFNFRQIGEPDVGLQLPDEVHAPEDGQKRDDGYAKPLGVGYHSRDLLFAVAVESGGVRQRVREHAAVIDDDGVVFQGSQLVKNVPDVLDLVIVDRKVQMKRPHLTVRGVLDLHAADAVGSGVQYLQESLERSAKAFITAGRDQDAVLRDLDGVSLLFHVGDFEETDLDAVFLKRLLRRVREIVPGRGYLGAELLAERLLDRIAFLAVNDAFRLRDYLVAFFHVFSRCSHLWRA